MALRIFFLLFCLFAAGGCSRALVQPPDLASPGEPPSIWDSLTSQTFRGALLGQPDQLFRLAAESEAEEMAAAKKNRPHPVLSDQIRLMALLASAPPLPTFHEASEMVSDVPRDENSRSSIQSLKKIEPKSRLREARKIHTYASIQNPINGVVQLGMGILQFELFSIVEFIAGTVQSIAQYPYPSPTGREVLRAQRDLLEHASLPRDELDLDLQAERGLERRRRLAILQARENSADCLKKGEPRRALWWLERVKRLAPGDTQTEDEIIQLRMDITRMEKEAELSLQTRPGEDDMQELNERVLYASMIRAMVEAPEGAEAAALRMQFLERYPRSPAVDAVRLSELASLRRRGKFDAARTVAKYLANNFPDAPAGEKAAALASAPGFSPSRDLESAQRQERKEWWNYLVFGERPNRMGSHASAEDARVRKAEWINYLRPVFVTDMINRLLGLAFGWPLDHRPALEAANRWAWASSNFAEASASAAATDDSAAAASSADEADLSNRLAQSRAEALLSDRRFDEAARAFREMTPPDEASAESAGQRAAKQRLKQAKAITQPELRAQALERLLNAFPNASAAREARKELDEAQRKISLILIIPKKDLLPAKSMWGAGALDLPPSLLDGNKANGEISSEGIELHRGDRVVWADAATGRREELAIAPQGFRAALYRLGPRKRGEKLNEELAKPGRMLRVPLQVEGTAMPGFEAYPGLLPLREQPEDALYR